MLQSGVFLFSAPSSGYAIPFWLSAPPAPLGTVCQHFVAAGNAVLIGLEFRAWGFLKGCIPKRLWNFSNMLIIPSSVWIAAQESALKELRLLLVNKMIGVNPVKVNWIKVERSILVHGPHKFHILIVGLICNVRIAESCRRSIKLFQPWSGIEPGSL